jgi:DNA-binding SARP family transcriptional activator
VSRPLEFRILGPLEVASDAGSLELPAGKPRALLALMLLSQGEVVSVDRIGG